MKTPMKLAVALLLVILPLGGAGCGLRQPAGLLTWHEYERRSEEVAHMKQRYPAEDVKLFFLLRAVAQHASRGAEGSLEAEVERILGILNASPGLMGPPRTIDEIAAAYRRRFPGRGEYRSEGQQKR